MIEFPPHTLVILHKLYESHIEYLSVFYFILEKKGAMSQNYTLNAGYLKYFKDLRKLFYCAILSSKV